MSAITVAAHPWDFEFGPLHTALFVIDMQRDFLAEAGYVHHMGHDPSLARKAIEPLRRVLATVRGTPMLVVHTREGHRPDLSDCPPAKLERSRRVGAEIGSMGQFGRLLVRGEVGHDFIPELQPAPGEIVVDKPGKSAFYATDLELLLRNRAITHLLISGVSTNVCVHSTARDAADRGYYNLILEDCCAASLPGMHDSAMDTFKRGMGVFGCVSDSSSLLAALQAK